MQVENEGVLSIQSLTKESHGEIWFYHSNLSIWISKLKNMISSVIMTTIFFLSKDHLEIREKYF